MRLVAQMSDTDLPGQVTIFHPTMDGVILGQEVFAPGQEHTFGTIPGVNVSFIPGEMRPNGEGEHVFVPYTGEQIADLQAAAVSAAEANGIALGEARALLRVQYDALCDMIEQAEQASDVEPDQLTGFIAQRDQMRAELLSMGVTFPEELAEAQPASDEGAD